MKNVLSVLPILSAVHRVVSLPNDSGITVPANAGIGVVFVENHLFVFDLPH
jgi:hypothetical protein